MRCMGHRFAAFDLDFYKPYQRRRKKRGKKVPKTIFFNILSPAGMAAALMAIFSCKSSGAVIVLAVVCGSWVSVSRGTTLRSYLGPLGDSSVGAVQVGNLLAARLGLCF